MDFLGWDKPNIFMAVYSTETFGLLSAITNNANRKTVLDQKWYFSHVTKKAYV